MAYDLIIQKWFDEDLEPGAAGGQTVAVAQVTETDTAQAITWAPKNRLVNLVTETDTAQALTRLKSRVLGQVTETDTAQAITRIKTKAVGQVTETDTAQPITRAGQTIAVAQVTETDTAQAISKIKVKAVGQVTETDTAQAITKVKSRAVGQVTETDTAQAVSKAKTKAVAQAVETDTAQPITLLGTKVIAVGQVVETDTALNIVRAPSGPGVIGPADPWYTEAWRKKKREAWPLPPPAFPPEVSPEILKFGDTPATEHKPSWTRPAKPSRRFVYRSIPRPVPPDAGPVSDRPRVRRGRGAIVDTSPTADDIIRYWRRKEEEEVVLALIARDALD